MDVRCPVLRVQQNIFLDSSMVEHPAVNRVVAGSSPARGVRPAGPGEEGKPGRDAVEGRKKQGSMVKRLRHRPFTAVTRVRFPLESFLNESCI